MNPLNKLFKPSDKKYIRKKLSLENLEYYLHVYLNLWRDNKTHLLNGIIKKPLIIKIFDNYIHYTADIHAVKENELFLQIKLILRFDDFDINVYQTNGKETCIVDFIYTKHIIKIFYNVNIHNLFELDKDMIKFKKYINKKGIKIMNKNG